jgi:D-alanyl-D-alanine carboxypeptidase
VTRARTALAASLGIVLVACLAPAPSANDVASRSRPSTSTARSPVVEHPTAQPERIAVAALTRPPQPPMSAALLVELVPDPCVDRDLPAPSSADIALSVLDRSYALPASYVPGDLVPAADAGFAADSGARLVRAVVIEDLAAMRDAWQAAGLTIDIDSAYRSYIDQEVTFMAWVAQLGLEAARQRVARPGHSEHQLGTAIDVTSPGWSGRFGDWARESAEGRWMAEHAWEYGFVMSYPAGAEAETCFGYEPWHYRWIGRDLAAEHRADGGPLRPFVAERAGG